MLRWRQRIAWMSAALFALNAAVAWRLFGVEYLSQTGTGESVTLAYARYARDHWPDFDWCRFWYVGLPFRNAYVPALHLTAAAVSWFLHISAALAFHHVVTVMYCLGPVTLFWMAFRLSRSAGWSFAAAMAYSLISPSAFLVADIRRDLGSLFWDQRLHTTVAYSDNPHVTSLTLIPLAILALDFALEKKTAFACVSAAVALALVPLTNWPGAIVLTFAVLAYGLSQPRAGSLQRWGMIAAIGGLAYALAVTWIPPSTVLATQADTQGFAPVNQFTAHHLLYAAALLGGAWVVLRLASATRAPRCLRFFLLFFYFMAAITLGWYYLGVTTIAQPWRFHLAMEMGFILSGTFLVRLAVQRWAFLGKPLATLFVALCIVQLAHYRSYSHRLIRSIDITQTSEFKTARWFDLHMRDSRVMVPGSSTFWLNVFTDTPQLTGCCPQGVLNQTARVADYGIMTDLTAESRAFENSMLWFKALGIRAVAVSGPRSTEVYKPFYHPLKFEGRLPVLWREGDDVIYEVPWKFYSIAHAMYPADLVQRTPAHGVDTEPLIPYVAAMESQDAPDLELRWTNNETMVIAGHLRAGQVVSIQENWDRGWHAIVNGSERPVFPDKLGLITVAPNCNDNCNIELRYDGGMEMQVAHWVNRCAIAGSIFWILFGVIGKKRSDLAGGHQGA